MCTSLYLNKSLQSLKKELQSFPEKVLKLERFVPQLQYTSHSEIEIMQLGFKQFPIFPKCQLVKISFGRFFFSTIISSQKYLLYVDCRRRIILIYEKYNIIFSFNSKIQLHNFKSSDTGRNTERVGINLSEYGSERNKHFRIRKFGINFSGIRVGSE